MVGSILTGENSLSGLAQRALRIVFGTPGHFAPAEAATRPQQALFRPNFPHMQAASFDAAPRRTGLSMTEAEDMLDWLEAHGQSGKVSFVPGEGFAVS
jgi:hypothetical protein